MGFRHNNFDVADFAADYACDGYAIIRAVFAADELAQIAAAFDQLHAEGVAHGRNFRHGNLFYNVTPAAGDAAPIVRMAQWPSYHQPLLDTVRRDPRIAAILSPLIGGDLKQIINQLHWKAPQSEPGVGGDFAWHQDSRFRKPDAAYRNLADSYVQTGLAIDPHTRASGAMRFVPRSHTRGNLDLDENEDVLGRSMADDALTRVGLSADDVIDLELAPGDLALWNPYLVHGSGTNRSTHQRRLYINGYVRSADCDRGEVTFVSGQPVPLGPEPALVHYEQLRERPDPHYP